MPKGSDTPSDAQTVAVKSKLERLFRSQRQTNSGEYSAATRHVIVRDEAALKLVSAENLLQERSLKSDSQQENSDRVRSRNVL